jgi:2-beta-glucuronyltransferase
MTSSEGVATDVLIFSEHDYRAPRRANLQPIADALVRLGHDVTFVSVRYSFLSVVKGDPRNAIRANVPEDRNGIRCYLWRTLVHPFNPGRALSALTAPLYRVYPSLRTDFVDEAIRRASIIIVESGLGAILLPTIRTLNRTCRLIYYASDVIGLIGAHASVQKILERSRDDIDFVCICSPKMAPEFRWMGERLHFVPHGINPADFVGSFDNPYSQPLNGISMGPSMFDPDFFEHALPAFPDVNFHVIGCGVKLRARPNLNIYEEMPFRETIRYIRNATFGIAPYRRAAGTDYVCDTSMKLMQFDYVGIPSVCSDFAAGNYAGRFGYRPSDPQSILAAIRSALNLAGQTRPKRQFLTWDDVAERVLNPKAFSDTRL